MNLYAYPPKENYFIEIYSEPEGIWERTADDVHLAGWGFDEEGTPSRLIQGYALRGYKARVIKVRTTLEIMETVEPPYVPE